jgi:SAM-dependent methyltransferase
MREVLRSVEERLERLGLKQSASQRLDDADEYWSEAGTEKWRSDSHWRGASAFGSDDDWLAVGADHVELTRRLAPGVLDRDPAPRILEWGVGGGANAVHFAPLAAEFIAVDIVQKSLDESGRQVRATCDTSYRPMLADIAHPEGIAADNLGVCDLFLCFYVLELVPSEEYGLRLVRIAQRLLSPGGVAIVQIKYSTADRRTRSHSRRYRRNLGSMTSYAIDEFWVAAERCGFAPRTVALVPKNRLDERYAYFALEKPSSSNVR